MEKILIEIFIMQASPLVLEHIKKDTGPILLRLLSMVLEQVWETGSNPLKIQDLVNMKQKGLWTTYILDIPLVLLWFLGERMSTTLI